MMSMLLLYVSVYVIILLMLMLLSIACGFALHYIISGVSLEMGIVAGAIITGFSMYLLVRVMSSFKDYEEEENALEAEFEKALSRRRSRRKRV